MWTTVLPMIFYIHSILLHSIYTLDDPLEAIKPHPIWTMYVQNSRRECLYLYKPPPLPANKWSNHLLINFTRLKELKITGMPIHLFEEEAFCGLSKLQRLQMRFCEISEMPPLNPVKRTLSRITLTHNRIMSIAADYFFGFANLRYLELSHNCLMSVSQLHPLSATLEHLYLDSNRLQHFPTSVHNVTYTLLLTLSLSGNNLIEFTKDVLGNLQNLGRLNLRTNSISRVEDLRSIHRLGRLTIWLSFNPVYCDEDLVWVRSVPDDNGKPQLFKKKHLVIKGNDLQCAGPERLAERLVLSLRLHEFYENGTEEITGVAVMEDISNSGDGTAMCNV